MNQVVIVTGASSGLGEATALRMAAAGYIVYAGARRLARMKHLEAAGIRILPLDVTKDHSMQQFVAAVNEREKRIDVLVNNAGFGQYGSLEDVSIEEARYQMEVNIFGLTRMTQLVLPTMRAQGSGQIINISSIAGKLAAPLGGWYHASKFALEALSDSLRNEVSQFGIKVTIIEPGGVKSEWSTIAMDNLKTRSQGTPYEPLAKRVIGLFGRSTRSQPPPEIIAELILRATSAKKPKARYHAGSGSSLILLRRFIPDSLFDRMMMFAIGRST